MVIYSRSPLLSSPASMTSDHPNKTDVCVYSKLFVISSACCSSMSGRQGDARLILLSLIDWQPETDSHHRPGGPRRRESCGPGMRMWHKVLFPRHREVRVKSTNCLPNNSENSFPLNVSSDRCSAIALLCRRNKHLSVFFPLFLCFSVFYHLPVCVFRLIAFFYVPPSFTVVLLNNTGFLLTSVTCCCTCWCRETKLLSRRK